MAKKIAVLGAGAWGTALAVTLQRHGHIVHLWGRDADACAALRAGAGLPRYLPDISLPALTASDDLATVVTGAELILLVTPAQTTAQMVAQLAELGLPAGVPVLACAKGIDRSSGQTQTQIIKQALPQADVGVLSGPSFAADVARGLPTAITLAMPDLARAQGLAEWLSGSVLRLYASDDPAGAEIGGALKNVMAIAVGIARGAGLGASAEAALIARGFAEMMRVGLLMGARSETLMGLSGLGDLVLTCSSAQSRNLSYGIAVGQGRDLSQLKLAEGAHTVGIARDLTQARGIEAPLIHATAAILAGQLTVPDAMRLLMQRPIKAEAERPPARPPNG